jgi:hypothetical protein
MPDHSHDPEVAPHRVRSCPRSVWTGNNSSSSDASQMKPVLGDFNGDGRADLAYFYNGAGTHTNLFMLYSNGTGYGGENLRWDSTTVNGGLVWSNFTPCDRKSAARDQLVRPAPRAPGRGRPAGLATPTAASTQCAAVSTSCAATAEPAQDHLRRVAPAAGPSSAARPAGAERRCTPAAR